MIGPSTSETQEAVPLGVAISAFSAQSVYRFLSFRDLVPELT